MKRRFLAIFLSLAMLLGLFLLNACEPQVASPPASPDSVPGAVTNVKSTWSSGDLVFTKNDGTTILKLDGTNGDTEITTATLPSPAISGTVTGGASYTAPTITSPVITSANISGTVTGGGSYSSITLTTPTISGTVSGTTVLTTANVTTLNVSGVATLTGTPVIANHASGNVTLSAGTGASTVTHGLGSAPSRIYLSILCANSGQQYLNPLFEQCQRHLF